MKLSARLVAMLVLSACLLPRPAAALTILLTNEEGWDALGIQTMKEALMAAGHDVIVVAPSSDQRRSGASLMQGPVAVSQESANEYAAETTPATCVAIGIAILGREPDLVVSGIHGRATLGAEVPFSGTVGAAIAAIAPQTASVCIPAIALSTGFSSGGTGDGVLIGTDLLGIEDLVISAPAAYEAVAAFAVNLIAYLEGGPAGLGEGLLPPGIALNVNYPVLPPEVQIRGIQVAVQGQISFESPLFFRESEPGLFVPSPGRRRRVIQEVPGADTTAFSQGYLTIVPLMADYTANVDVADTLAFALQRLMPTGEAPLVVPGDCNNDGRLNALDVLGIGCRE